MFYMPKYMCKDCCDLKECLPLIRSLRIKALKYKSNRDAPEEEAGVSLLLNKILNKITANAEYSDTQCAMALLGLPSYYSSHKFWYTYIKDAIVLR